MSITMLRDQSMIKWDIAQVLNDRLDCTRCHASHAWVPAARPLVRQYSSIHRLRCAQCGEQVMAKVVGGRYSIAYAREHARREYESLCRLQSVFPQDEQYGTVVPLAHLEYERSGVVITRFSAGVDLMHYVRTLDAEGMQAACRSAGVWLKRLHESDMQDQATSLALTGKVDSLAESYGAVLRNNPSTKGAFELLAGHASRLEAMAVVAIRQHGDFKPDNLLCDGTRYIGLDIRWRTIGAAAYDLAPFLNHLWLDGRTLFGSRTNSLYDLLEPAFLAGYGNVGDMRALRWVQLYFALCYMGEYRLRGRLAACYAAWKVAPLVRRLVAQLETI